MYKDMLIEIFISHFLKVTAALLALRPTFLPSHLLTFLPSFRSHALTR